MLQNPFKSQSFTSNKYNINGSVTAKANEYPIEQMYSGTLKKSGKALLGKCPFHDDGMPSFAIYPETNTWNCFSGCGGGDAISYYMKLHNCEFKEALEALAV